VIVRRNYGTEQVASPSFKRERRQVRYGETSLQLEVLQDELLQPRVIEWSSLENQFEALARQWKAETAMLSLLSQKVLHPAYQRIIGMGEKAVPLLMKELEREPNHWFWALRAITGANPVQSNNRGRVKRMAQDWLTWGRQHGYCN